MTRSRQSSFAEKNLSIKILKEVFVPQRNDPIKKTLLEKRCSKKIACKESALIDRKEL